MRKCYYNYEEILFLSDTVVLRNSLGPDSMNIDPKHWMYVLNITPLASNLSYIYLCGTGSGSTTQHCRDKINVYLKTQNARFVNIHITFFILRDTFSEHLTSTSQASCMTQTLMWMTQGKGQPQLVSNSNPIFFHHCDLATTNYNYYWIPKKC